MSLTYKAVITETSFQLIKKASLERASHREPRRKKSYACERNLSMQDQIRTGFSF